MLIAGGIGFALGEIAVSEKPRGPSKATIEQGFRCLFIAPRLRDGLLWAGCASRKAYNHDFHPIRILASNLDDKRLQLIEKLATDKSISADVTKELATVQAALTAFARRSMNMAPEWVGAAIRS
jgi:hypothetical protein